MSDLTCLMCMGINSRDCDWCEDGVVPENMLFKPPGEMKAAGSKTPKPAPRLVAPPHEYQLFAFLRTSPSYHLVKSTNEYRTSYSWCGKQGRTLSVEPGEVPRCNDCERAKAEDELTARQQVESRRLAKTK